MFIISYVVLQYGKSLFNAEGYAPENFNVQWKNMEWSIFSHKNQLKYLSKLQ